MEQMILTNRNHKRGWWIPEHLWKFYYFQGNKNPKSRSSSKWESSQYYQCRGRSQCEREWLFVYLCQPCDDLSRVVPRLSSSVWDRLQLPHDPLKDRRVWMMDGWMDDILFCWVHLSLLSAHCSPWWTTVTQPICCADRGWTVCQIYLLIQTPSLGTLVTFNTYLLFSITPNPVIQTHFFVCWVDCGCIIFIYTNLNAVCFCDLLLNDHAFPVACENG